LGDLSFFLAGTVKDIQENKMFVEFLYNGKVYMEEADAPCDYLKSCGLVILTRTDCWFY